MFGEQGRIALSVAGEMSVKGYRGMRSNAVDSGLGEGMQLQEDIALQSIIFCIHHSTRASGSGTK